MTDRRAVGADLRGFEGGSSVFSRFDCVVLMKGLNVATVQCSDVAEDNTVCNALYDRRTRSTLSPGNALTFEHAANPGVLYTRMQGRLADTSVQSVRDRVGADLRNRPCHAGRARPGEHGCEPDGRGVDAAGELLSGCALRIPGGAT